MQARNHGGQTRSRRRMRTDASSSSPSTTTGTSAATTTTTTTALDILLSSPVVPCDAADDKSAVTLSDALPALPKQKVVALLLTHFADFDSFELAKGMMPYLDDLEAAGITLVAVGIGSSASGRRFAELTGFPTSKLYCDPAAVTHASLGLAAGFGREGGIFGGSSLVSGLGGIAKLLVMCAGIGSPGTLREVLRGYTGDGSQPAIFREEDEGYRGLLGRLFSIVGRDRQRPFELATVRLINMAAIIPEFESLAPADDQLLVQRGGAFIFDAGKEVYAHRDKGILGAIPARKLAERALRLLSPDDASEASVAAAASSGPDVDVLHAAATRSAWAEDVYVAMQQAERRSQKDKEDITIDAIDGTWRLQFTGPKMVPKDATDDASFGSYFPLEARQRFNKAGTIRNGVYFFGGKVASLFFDGVFDWDDKVRDERWPKDVCMCVFTGYIMVVVEAVVKN